MIQQSSKKFSDKARKEYGNRNLDACLECLHELRKDPSVNHSKREMNRALVFFAKSRWKSLESYRNTLNKLFPDETKGKRGKLSSNLPVLCYNLAVLEFHSGSYSKALEYLTALVAAEEDDSTAKKISPKIRMHSLLLMIEILLMFNLSTKACTMLEKLDEEIVMAKPTFESYMSEQKIEQQFEYAYQRCRLQMKDPQWSEIGSRSRRTNNGSEEHFKHVWKEHLMQAQSHYLNASSMDIAVKKIHDAQKTYPQGWGLGNTCECCQLITENNFGCISGKLENPLKALSHFQRAFQSIANHSSAATTRETFFSCPTSTRNAVAFNMAIAGSHVDGDGSNYQSALENLMGVIDHYRRNPRLWLRCAEICISARIMSVEKSLGHGMIVGTEGVRMTPLGSGRYRQMYSRYVDSNPGPNKGFAPAAIPALNMEFALLSLRNALYSLPKLSNKELDSLKSIGNDGNGGKKGVLSSDETKLYVFQPTVPLNAGEVHRLRVNILISLAYVAMCLGETEQALQHSCAALDLPLLTATHRSQALVYKAECLMILNEPHEAVDVYKEAERTAGAVNSEEELPAVAELWRGAEPNHIFKPHLQELIMCNLALAHRTVENFSEHNRIMNMLENRSGDTRVGSFSIVPRCSKLISWIENWDGNIHSLDAFRERFPNVHVSDSTKTDTTKTSSSSTIN